MFLETKTLRIDDIYVPVKRRKELDAAKVEALAESILADGMKAPIGVRQDGGRVVLVSGLHRLEACRTLGETTIAAIFVAARQH
jgi:ParB-like chromosome segregation protein Spo0J